MSEVALYSPQDRIAEADWSWESPQDPAVVIVLGPCRDTSLIRKRLRLAPCSRNMPRVLGRACFLVSAVSLYPPT